MNQYLNKEDDESGISLSDILTCWTICVWDNYEMIIVFYDSHYRVLCSLEKVWQLALNVLINDMFPCKWERDDM